MGDPQFVKRFKEAERPGVYCRVISEGKVSAGDSVTLKPYPRPQQTITVLEFSASPTSARSAANRCDGYWLPPSTSAPAPPMSRC
ncbi:MAG: MOSC domain-containing protein [Anaerolineae bacterium]